MIPPMVEKDTVITFKVESESRDAYDRAARAAKMDRSAWMRMILDAASGQSDLPAQMARVVTVQSKPVKDGKW